MQLPKFILGAAIIFWGWQTGLWYFALPIAIAHESSFWLKWRWRFTTANFRQVSHLCTAILVLVLIYLWNTDASLKFIFLFFRWVPVICFPLLIAQAYSDSEGIDLGALLFFSEKPQQKARSRQLISLHYPFFAICLIAASAGNTRDTAFYFGVVLFTAIAFWFKRSQRVSAIAWVSVLLLSAIIGFFGHLSLHHAHLTLERKTLQWVRQFYRYHSSNPTQSNTAIGDIGAVKLTNKIVLRVKPKAGNLPPKLLRRVTYNRYNSGLWLAAKSQFQPLAISEDTINFLPSQKSQNSDREVTIYRTLEEGQNLLNLPDGTNKISQLPVEEIQVNQYGVVRVTSEPSLAAYRVSYNPEQINDSPPTATDLAIPESELPAIETVLQSLNLQDKSEAEIIRAVSEFFNQNFTYSLELAYQRNNKTPLSAFLLDHRSGHCEYFATATALLLRAAGIPTRYTIGYSVHEFSSLEQQYIVRGKNAHAWNLVYLDGAWQELDNTPASWIAMESNLTSNLAVIGDFFSWLGFKIAQFNELIKFLSQKPSFWLVIIPILSILLWWLLRKKDRSSLQIERVIHQQNNYKLCGTDSEIYLIERALSDRGIAKQSAESWQQWLIRIEKNKQLDSEQITRLKAIIQIHYSYRFDPQGISSQKRQELQSAVKSWLNGYQALKTEVMSNK